MSIMTESNVYETIGDDGLSHKLCLAACEATNQFMFIPKIEHNVGGTMYNNRHNICEEIIDVKSSILNAGVIQDTYDGTGQTPVYYEEALNACEEVEVDYKPSLSSMLLPSTKIEDAWEENHRYESPTMPNFTSTQESLFEETQMDTSFCDESGNVEDSDEETIATFLTSAGQRLALYAVEDSDEVFAVAVYDESGEPPTNFQFLMKSDVERLIGEGAVRTVKKPTQIKKQLLSNEPPVFTQQHKEEVTYEEPQLENDTRPSLQYQNDEYETHNTTTTVATTTTTTTTTTWNDDTALQSSEPVEDTEIKSSPLPDADTQSSFTYVLMDDTCTAINQCNEKEEDSDDNSELVEQSTVQCKFFENEQSDAELTFDDIVETMKNFKPNERKSLLKKSSSTIVDPKDDNPSFNGTATVNWLPDSPAKVGTPTSTEVNSVNTTNSISQPCRNPASTKKGYSSLICRRENFIDERFNISGTSLLIANAEAKISAEPNTATETTQAISRVKRSRKQQLTSVNRGDSEIIIQPATFPSEEDETTKKRGRGRRKGARPAAHKTKAVIAKKVRRSLRPRPVEVIEIDVDEDELPKAKKNIVEITIDENKEKGSSDKENEVIMVGDSDDETQEVGTSKIATSLLKCDHCSRSFRQKRALETHSRVCPKSPDTVRRLNERLKQRSSTRSNDSPVEKKQYTCKICQEKFDVVVALARHVRSMHSQRKKMNSTNQSTPVTKTPESPPKVEETPKKIETAASPTATRKKKTKTKTKNSNRSWKAKKLHCEDCGRWFSSDASLSAHCLQHATKKSEKQTRRCQTCKKLFKSRLLYIRHMRMHSRAKQLQKKLHHTRLATSKLTALRKRGRPRKL